MAQRPRSKSSSNSQAPAETLTGHRPPRPEDGTARGPAFNIAESPLSWLRSRKDRDGQPLISDPQFISWKNVS